MNLYSKPLRIFIDLLALMLAYGGAYLFHYESGIFSVNHRGEFISAALFLSTSWVIVFAVFGHYAGTFALGWIAHAKRVALAVSIGGLTLFWLTFEAENPLPPGRFVLVVYGIGIILLVASGRAVMYYFQQARWKSGKGLARTAIVGHGRWADILAEEFSSRPESGHSYVGMIRLPGDTGKLPSPVLGDMNELETILPKNRIECVVLAWEHGHTEEVLQGIMACNHAQVQVQVCPDLRDEAASWARLQTRDDLPLFVVKSDFHPNWERLLKRAVGGTNA